jgi:hypothetical protein
MSAWAWAALAAAAIAVVLLAMRQRQRRREPHSAGRSRKSQALEGLDTVVAWEPQATRILSGQERQAYAVLVRALPEYMVLAQVPLSRFLKVPTRYSYAEWIKRAGSLSADLVVCDRTSEVIAVVEVRSPRDSGRSRARQERMKRVLAAAKIRVLEWEEGNLPTPALVRAQLLPAEEAAPEQPMAGRQFGATPLSSLPVADVDDSGPGGLHEPPPSTWFDDLDDPGPAAPAPGSGPLRRL